MIKRDACLWGWEEGGEGRRRETHGLWQMWSQQDVLGWVIPSLWLLAFFRLLVSLQLNDGYLFQVTNPLTVWNPTLCHAENTHTRTGSMCVNSESSSASPSCCLSCCPPAFWYLLKLTKEAVLVKTEPEGKVCMKKNKCLCVRDKPEPMSYINMTVVTMSVPNIHCMYPSL